MKIACLDKSAADRLCLQELIDSAYEKCRHSLGHLLPASTYPASLQQVLLGEKPDAVVLGPELGEDEAYSACRDIRKAAPDLPLLLFLKERDYTLRTLRRFERFSIETFCTEESATRLIFQLTAIVANQTHSTPGKLVTVSAAKGGVGVTSVVAALAHAAEARGKTALVLDLSNLGALAHYLGAERWQSTEYASYLADKLIPDEAFVRRNIVKAPNGISVFLPPAGASDVREMWLRSADHFELSLSIVEILQQLFDFVFVDCGTIEGILVFALHAHAQERVLISTNDPASVHLLHYVLPELHQIPGAAKLRILLNMTIPRGLQNEDIRDILRSHDFFQDELVRLPILNFDAHASQWMGTGNTFYTEGNRHIQTTLESMIDILGDVSPLQHPEVRRLTMFSSLARSLKNWMSPAIVAPPRALPLLSPMKLAAVATTSPAQSRAIVQKQHAIGTTVSTRISIPESALLYEPPQAEGESVPQACIAGA